MGRLYFTVGLPASGKSSYFEKIKEWHPDAVHISSDNIREEVFGDVNRQDKNTEVFKIMEERTYETLAANGVCFYDATNLSAKRRIAFLKNMKARLKDKDISYECVLFVPTIKECIERDLNRNRTVGADVIMKMVKQFQSPHKSEGWDLVDIVTPVRENALDESWNYLNGLCRIGQDNSHHSLTIGNHCIQALKWAERNDFNSVVCRAALLHDAGKELTKVWHNRKGEVTTEAHYFNHENVGAYLALAYRWSANDDKWLEIANLIVWHMVFYNKEKDTVLYKICKRYGVEFYNHLVELHECDQKSH